MRWDVNRMERLPMGVTTDAILFWGLAIEEVSELHDRINRERVGEDGPDEGTLGYLSWMGDPDCGCIVGRHCSGEYPMWFVAVQETVKRAWRGHTVPIDPENMTAFAGDRRRKLLAFCEKYGVPCDDPGWWLVSYWG